MEVLTVDVIGCVANSSNNVVTGVTGLTSVCVGGETSAAKPALLDALLVVVEVVTRVTGPTRVVDSVGRGTVQTVRNRNAISRTVRVRQAGATGLQDSRRYGLFYPLKTEVGVWLVFCATWDVLLKAFS